MCRGGRSGTGLAWRERRPGCGLDGLGGRSSGRRRSGSNRRSYRGGLRDVVRRHSRSRTESKGCTSSCQAADAVGELPQFNPCVVHGLSLADRTSILRWLARGIPRTRSNLGPAEGCRHSPTDSGPTSLSVHATGGREFATESGNRDPRQNSATEIRLPRSGYRDPGRDSATEARHSRPATAFRDRGPTSRADIGSRRRSFRQPGSEVHATGVGRRPRNRDRPSSSRSTSRSTSTALGSPISSSGSTGTLW